MTSYSVGAYERLKLILLFSFVFSFPFLYFDPFGIRYFFTINAMFFLLYFLVLMLKPRENLSFKKKSFIIFPLFFLWIVFTIHNVFSFYDFQLSGAINKTFPQILVMLLLIITHLSKDTNALGVIRKSLSLSMILCSVLILNGIGLQAGHGEDFYGGRLYFFGMNPNSLGNIAAFTLTVNALYFLDRTKGVNLSLSWIQLLSIFSCLWVLLFTASRGAFLAAGLGVIFAFLLSKLSFSKKLLISLLVAVFLLPIILYMFDFSLIESRLSDSHGVGTLGNRTGRWVAALDIFSNYPLFGVGTNGYDTLTDLYYGFAGSPHNLFIQVLALSGLLGFSLFMIAIIFASKLAVNTYRKFKESTPLVVLIFFLIIMSKDGGALNATFNWFVLAISVGAGLHILKNNRVEL